MLARSVAIPPRAPREPMSIRQTFRDKPWLFVVVGLGLLLGLSLFFVLVAILNPPELIGR